MNEEARRFPDWLPYVLPYGLFLAITWLGSVVPGAQGPSYLVRLVAVAAAIAWFWRKGCYPELDLRPSLLGIGVGVVGFLLWILPERLLAPIMIGTPSFDPASLGTGAGYTVLVATRIATAVLVVPIFEELFLRSFLIRYLDMVKEDRDGWKDLPIGRYRLFSFVGVIVAMAITHFRWLRAGAWSALVTLLLYREKRMGSVIWAHAVTNLLLDLYVVKTGAWAFW